MSLKSQLENARPGDVITFTGRQKLGKVFNIRGTKDAYITLQGEDDTAVLVPDPSYDAAIFRPEDCGYFKMKNFILEGAGNVERGISAFTSDYIEIEDVDSWNLPGDHIHTAGCNNVTIRRHNANGTGGRPLRPGVGPHAIYFSRVDGGGDVTDFLIEDCESHDIFGAAYQANGDGRTIHNVVARRVAGYTYGAMGGAGFNLAQCSDVTLEDITLDTHFNAGGVRAYDGSRGVTIARYKISVPSGPELEGVQVLDNGAPALPNFGTTPPVEPPIEPPPVDTTDWEAKYNEEKAKNDQWLAWYGQAPK